MNKRFQFIAMLLGLLCILIILVIRYFTGNPSTTSELLTFDELTKYTKLPVYHAGDTSQYGQLKTLYSYIDGGDQLHIYTYFVEVGNEPVVQLWTITVPTSDPPPINGTVSIKWATQQTGYICQPPTEASQVPSLKVITYITCFYWIDQQGGARQILYSAWGEQKTVEFVNSLLRAN